MGARPEYGIIRSTLTRELRSASRPMTRKYEPNEIEPIVVHEIALREGNDSAANPEQPEDREVLARLRHHPFVSRDDEEREVDPGRAGQHGAHERFVSRHIHDTDNPDVRHLERCESQVDRDPAALLFRESIGVDAGQRANERGLAVVDVPGGPNDHGVMPTPGTAAAVFQPFRSHTSYARSGRPSVRCSARNSRSRR